MHHLGTGVENEFGIYYLDDTIRMDDSSGFKVQNV